MIIGEIFESAARGTLSLIVDVSLNVCEEIFKFILILLMLYYFTMWSFTFLENITDDFEVSTQRALPNDNQNNLNTELDFEKIYGETCIRIGPPDENLINQRASLLEQLEIEAEFEEHQEKRIKSEASKEKSVKKEIKTEITKTENNGDSASSSKDKFIDQLKYESYVDKKYKKANEEDKPTTSNGAPKGQEKKDKQFVNKLNTNQDLQIKKEPIDLSHVKTEKPSLKKENDA